MGSAVSDQKLARARAILAAKVMPNRCDVSTKGTPTEVTGGYQGASTPIVFADQECGILTVAAMSTNRALQGVLVATPVDWGISLEFGTPAAEAVEPDSTITTDTGLVLNVQKVIRDQSWSLSCLCLCTEQQGRR
jgi:hypothetical protein